MKLKDLFEGVSTFDLMWIMANALVGAEVTLSAAFEPLKGPVSLISEHQLNCKIEAIVGVRFRVKLLSDVTKDSITLKKGTRGYVYVSEIENLQYLKNIQSIVDNNVIRTLLEYLGSKTDFSVDSGEAIRAETILAAIKKLRSYKVDLPDFKVIEQTCHKLLKQ